MYRTIKIKLDRSNELVQTARLWNSACQDVIDYGFAAHDYNKTRLNKATYKDLREKYPTLPSALIQTARDQAVICSRGSSLRLSPSSILLVPCDLTLEP